MTEVRAGDSIFLKQGVIVRLLDANPGLELPRTNFGRLCVVGTSERNISFRWQNGPILIVDRSEVESYISADPPDRSPHALGRGDYRYRFDFDCRQ